MRLGWTWRTWRFKANSWCQYVSYLPGDVLILLERLNVAPQIGQKRKVRVAFPELVCCVAHQERSAEYFKAVQNDTRLFVVSRGIQSAVNDLFQLSLRSCYKMTTTDGYRFTDKDGLKAGLVTEGFINPPERGIDANKLYDIIIIGAGYAGLVTSRELASKGSL